MLIDAGDFAKIDNAIRNLINWEFWKANLRTVHQFFTNSIIILSEILEKYSVIKTFSCS